MNGGNRQVVGGVAAACAVCCAAPVVGFLGVAGFAATAVTLAFAGVVFGLVLGALTVAALLVRRARTRAAGRPVPPATLDLGPTRRTDHSH